MEESKLNVRYLLFSVPLSCSNSQGYHRMWFTWCGEIKTETVGMGSSHRSCIYFIGVLCKLHKKLIKILVAEHQEVLLALVFCAIKLNACR